jgi:hypothetical protein
VNRFSKRLEELCRLLQPPFIKITPYRKKSARKRVPLSFHSLPGYDASLDKYK